MVLYCPRDISRVQILKEKEKIYTYDCMFRIWLGEEQKTSKKKFSLPANPKKA